jgi:hypothetical protein
MFNAKITFQNLGGDWKEITVAPFETTDMEHNEREMRETLRGAQIKRSAIKVHGEEHVDFEAWTASLSPEAVMRLLDSYLWIPEFQHSLKTVREFLRGTGKRDPEIDSWLFMAPQLKFKGQSPSWQCNGKQFAVRQRARVTTEGRYKVYSEPDHRFAAEVFVGLKSGQIETGGSDLRRARQAVLLFYPVQSEDESGLVPTMGFALLFPKNSIRDPITYSVENELRAEEVVVPK